MEERRARTGGDAESDETSGAIRRAVAETATRQAGAVSTRQLLGAGLHNNTIWRRARGGELHRQHRGVYLVGHEAPASHTVEWAAILACGARAIVSHVSAAAVWGLVERPAEVDVIVVGRQLRSRDGIHVHRTQDMPPSDVRRVNALPVTSPLRTLLDLAAIEHSQLERALAEAHARRHIRDSDLDRLVKRSRGRRGASVLRRLIDDERRGYTRSEAERVLRRLLKDARLPQPLSNAKLAGFEVDFFWPGHCLIVEVDGFAVHGHRKAFERDRRKDAVLTAGGYRVIRITWRQLTDEPLAVAAVLARALAAT